MALDCTMVHILNTQFDPDRGQGNVVVGLMAESRVDVDGILRKVKRAGHPVGQEPYDAFFGSRYATVSSPTATGRDQEPNRSTQ